MIDLATIGPEPIGVVTDYVFNSQTGTSCDAGWVGSRTPQERPYRLHHLKWSMSSKASAASFYATLEATVGGNEQVVLTPPNDPASLRVEQMETIVGRLVKPFSIRHRGMNDVTITADLREDM